jgi:hypothetical protein
MLSLQERIRRRISRMDPQNPRAPFLLLHTLVAERVGVRRFPFRFMFMGRVGVRSEPYLQLPRYGLVGVHRAWFAFLQPPSYQSSSIRLVVPHHENNGTKFARSRSDGQLRCLRFLLLCLFCVSSGFERGPLLFCSDSGQP